MAKKAVLLGESLEAAQEYLVERGHEVVVHADAEVSMDEAKRLLADAHGVIARMRPIYGKELVDAAPKLEVIARVGVGLENVDLDYCTSKGIWVTVAPQGNVGAVAEQALALIMDSAKKIALMDRETRKGNFNIRHEGLTYLLEGKTLGIIGLGRIGRSLAQKAHDGLGMEVVAYDSMADPAGFPPYVKAMKTMQEVFEAADYVSIHMASTPADKDLIGKDCFGRMKPGACLVNCARGLVLNEKDLYDALKSGQIAWAGLDVLHTEPFDMSSPMFTLPNVTFSPHLAGITRESWRLICLQAATNVDEVFRGEKPHAPANSPKK